MSHHLDCLIIGHNQLEISEFETALGTFGKNSEVYRSSMNLDFIQMNGKKYSGTDAFNYFFQKKHPFDAGFEKLGAHNMFSSAIAYLGAYLNRRGITFDYVNSFSEEKSQLAEKLQGNEILSIAITTTLYVSFLPIKEIIEFVKKYNDTAKIIVGGPFIFHQLKTQEENLQSLLSPTNVDFYVVNAQGETALVNIINALKQNLPFETIDNIYYRAGKEYKGTRFYFENNLLQDNMVDWDLFGARNESYAGIRTSTSCPFSCSFCSYTKLAGKYQTVGIECIEKELDALRDIGKVKMLNFIDDTFNIPPERFKAILKMMIKKRYDFRWASFFRCQYADREMVELMKESGCIGAFLGIESANDVVLKNMNKAVTAEQYRKGMKLLNEYEILSLASILIGFPGETPDTVRETVEFIEELHPFGYHVNLWYCNPFAPIWEQRDRFGIKGEGQQWSHQTMDSMQACDHFEDMVLNIKNSFWIPYFDFDFLCIGYLMVKGLKLEQLKNFMGGFNEGIKEKIKEPDKVEISPATYQKMAASFEE